MKKIFTAICFLSLALLAASQHTIPLYEKIPNSRISKDEEQSQFAPNGILIISKVSVPRLIIFLPPKEKANGTAVVICPGGGYSILAASHEGSDVAKQFNKMGVAAFVLKYRIPSDATMENKEIGPLQDAQRAIQFVREHAKQYNVNPDRIGIMGFSAGGHLASTVGTHFTKSLIDNKNNISVRPDFMILIYPVISFTDSIGHIGSRNNLLGSNPSPEKIIEYSNELQVTARTPPSFLVHAGDDDVVNVQNSIAFYQALKKNKVNAEMHIYPKGGHGFGMNNPTTKDKWMERCINWLDGNGWMRKGIRD